MNTQHKSHDMTAEQEKAQEQLGAFVKVLEDEAERRVKLRSPTETRWLADLGQYHGRYDEGTQKRLTDEEGSQVFVNLTRPKTNAFVARLSDLLFPTDDRNWGIRPTPVPDMADEAEENKKLAMQAEESKAEGEAALDAATASGDEAAQKQASQQMAEADEIRDEALMAAHELEQALAAASRRSDLMQEEIDDQLKTCGYQSEARDAIEDACKLGTGILKGPILNDKGKKRFRKIGGGAEQGDAEQGEAGQEGQSAELFELFTEYSDIPGAVRVDPWSFFPDPDARKVEDCEGIYERHLMTKAQMRKLANRPDIDEDEVRDLLRDGVGSERAPSYMAQLSAITEDKSTQNKDLYHVWEYTGPIEPEDLETLALNDRDGGLLEEMEEEGEIDPLTELHARVWFCNGRLLSFNLHPLDSGEPIYSVFNFERDEMGLFGFGVPYLMRHEQSIINSSMRMMLDNGALATGPQVLINRDAVEPVDGSWKLKPRKVWQLKGSTALTPAGPAPFQTFSIDMHQNELANMIELTRRTIDDITMPSLAQGEQGAGVTKTAQGMALLMNSANIVFRRIVKNWDDDMTVPMIRRFYHWNMQFSDKDAIKGDFDVDARGSSVLLVREMQAQNLMMIATTLGDHPIFGPMHKHMDLLRQIYKAHMISPHEVLKTEVEIQEDKRKQAEQGDPAAQVEMERMKIEEQRLQLDRDKLEQEGQIKNMEWDAKREIARLTHDAQMTSIAEALNMKRDDLDARMEMHTASANERRDAAGIKAASDERKLATEVAMAERTGQSAGGSV